uniref:Uncharacterized protein n=1 Tax=Arundo donax TaxID=35708 RepID=A0A0A9EI35_ARUDO
MYARSRRIWNFAASLFMYQCSRALALGNWIQAAGGLQGLRLPR